MFNRTASLDEDPWLRRREAQEALELAEVARSRAGGRIFGYISRGIADLVVRRAESRLRDAQEREDFANQVKRPVPRGLLLDSLVTSPAETASEEGCPWKTMPTAMPGVDIDSLRRHHVPVEADLTED